MFLADTKLIYAILYMQVGNRMFVLLDATTDTDTASSVPHHARGLVSFSDCRAPDERSHPPQLESPRLRAQAHSTPDGVEL